MFDKSYLDESLRYRAFWKFFSDIVQRIGIFGIAFLILALIFDPINIVFFIILLLALTVEYILSFYKINIILLNANLFPLFFVGFAIVFLEFFTFSNYALLLIFLGTFTIFELLEEYFFFLKNSVYKGIAFAIIQISRLPITIGMFIYLQELLSNISSFKEISVSIDLVYLISNFFIIFICYVALTTTLFIKKNKLVTIKKEFLLEEKAILAGKILNFSLFIQRHELSYTTLTLESLYRIVQDNIIKYNGLLSEPLGEKFFIYFDNIHDALQCVFSLKDSLNNYLGELFLSIGLALEIGNLIEIYSTFGEENKFILNGHTVKAAEILCSYAKANEILVTEQFFQKYKNIDYVKTGTMSANSKPIQLYNALGFTGQ